MRVSGCFPALMIEPTNSAVKLAREFRAVALPKMRAREAGSNDDVQVDAGSNGDFSDDDGNE